jgi:hypothetical protein
VARPTTATIAAMRTNGFFMTLPWFLPETWSQRGEARCRLTA